MKIVELVRIESGSEGTFGVLKINKQAFCVTLEPNLIQNITMAKVGDIEAVCCAIPTGQYICAPIESPKFGGTFKVKDVQGRSNILFHPGNVVEDTTGCILVGESFGKLRGDRAILNSGKTFKSFLCDVGRQPFHLTITEES